MRQIIKQKENTENEIYHGFPQTLLHNQGNLADFGNSLINMNMDEQDIYNLLAEGERITLECKKSTE